LVFGQDAQAVAKSFGGSGLRSCEAIAEVGESPNLLVGVDIPDRPSNVTLEVCGGSDLEHRLLNQDVASVLGVVIVTVEHLHSMPDCPTDPAIRAAKAPASLLHVADRS
jgi:hypothetical protein